jgi:hypothetical protein
VRFLGRVPEPEVSAIQPEGEHAATSGERLSGTPLRHLGRQIVGLRCEFSVQFLTDSAEPFPLMLWQIQDLVKPQ